VFKVCYNKIDSIDSPSTVIMQPHFIMDLL